MPMLPFSRNAMMLLPAPWRTMLKTLSWPRLSTGTPRRSMQLVNTWRLTAFKPEDKVMTLWSKTVKLVTGIEPSTKLTVPRLRKVTRRDLIRMESKIGSTVFGSVPASHRREFFCLDEHTWIWYEEWIDEATGQRREMTTRYEVHPHGVLKVQDGQPYALVEGEELRNLAIATRMYREQVMRNVYRRDPVTGQRLSASTGTM